MHTGGCWGRKEMKNADEKYENARKASGCDYPAPVWITVFRIALMYCNACTFERDAGVCGSGRTALAVGEETKQRLLHCSELFIPLPPLLNIFHKYSALSRSRRAARSRLITFMER